MPILGKDNNGVCI